MCAVADAVIDGMLPELAGGTLKKTALPPESLGRQDACQLLRYSDVRRHVRFRPTELRPEYGRHDCAWTTSPETGPVVRVRFTRDRKPTAFTDTEREIVVRDKTAILNFREGPAVGDTYHELPTCSVELAYQRIDDARYETVMVAVASELPKKDICQAVTNLAEVVVGRLPRR
jgi:hypothetical protein